MGALQSSAPGRLDGDQGTNCSARHVDAAGKPLKTVLNLSTAIDTLSFNHDSQMMVMASRLKRDALRWGKPHPCVDCMARGCCTALVVAFCYSLNSAAGCHALAGWSTCPP
jgi:hypothetical protein